MVGNHSRIFKHNFEVLHEQQKLVCFPLSNKAFFLNKSEFSDVGSLRNLIFTQYFTNFYNSSFLLMKLRASPDGFVLHHCNIIDYLKGS